MASKSIASSLVKFRDDLQRSVTKNLLEDDNIVSDVKNSINIRLGQGRADENRNETIKHFNQLVSDKTDVFFEGNDLHELFNKLKKIKRAKTTSDPEASLNSKQYSYAARKPIMIEYKNKLEKSQKKLNAELQKELEENAKLTVKFKA